MGNACSSTPKAATGLGDTDYSALPPVEPHTPKPVVELESPEKAKQAAQAYMEPAVAESEAKSDTWVQVEAPSLSASPMVAVAAPAVPEPAPLPAPAQPPSAAPLPPPSALDEISSVSDLDNTPSSPKPGALDEISSVSDLDNTSSSPKPEVSHRLASLAESSVEEEASAKIFLEYPPPPKIMDTSPEARLAADREKRLAEASKRAPNTYPWASLPADASAGGAASVGVIDYASKLPPRASTESSPEERLAKALMQDEQAAPTGGALGDGDGDRSSYMKQYLGLAMAPRPSGGSQLSLPPPPPASQPSLDERFPSDRSLPIEPRARYIRRDSKPCLRLLPPLPYTRSLLPWPSLLPPPCPSPLPPRCLSLPFSGLSLASLTYQRSSPRGHSHQSSFYVPLLTPSVDKKAQAKVRCPRSGLRSDGTQSAPGEPALRGPTDSRDWPPDCNP